MKSMLKTAMLTCGLVASATAWGHGAAPMKDKTASADADARGSMSGETLFQPKSVESQGSVTVGGQNIAYHAVAGTIVVHPKGYDDTAWRVQKAKGDGDRGEPAPEASIFYTAYFKNGAPSANRPITFLYNGGPGSSTVWLHMGAFGPRRVVTADDTHTAAAPYSLVNNDDSLLDASDLVFIDAPGTGFSRVAGKDADKAFYGIDQDAYAFSSFIRQFLSKYGRWNSPKYLFGESYGTPRSAVLINDLTTDDSIDFNGVILLSQILDFHLFAGMQGANPDSVGGYVTQLPTYAATAWYHNLIPGGRPAQLEPFLQQVESFATGEYAAALMKGSELDDATKRQVAQKMAQYTGLPVDYIMKSDLRVDGPEYSKELQDATGMTTGRLDTRFSGPSLDPLSKEAEYDPQSAALGSAYVSLFNQYARQTLKWSDDETFKPEINVDWDWSHGAPGFPPLKMFGSSVIGDLATAMKFDPKLKVMTAGGYFDLATPFYEGWYEMHHLPIPASLRDNLEFHYYKSGHMVYAHQQSLDQLHADAAAFIRKTDNVGG